MKENNQIQLATPDVCTGCAACEQMCPKHAITMREDKDGFLRPFIDKKLCVECHKCEKNCPILTKEVITDTFETKAYAVINKDEKIRMQSSSGGVFYALAKWVIDQGGVVFGAKWDEKWEVVHDYAEDLESVKAFMRSKYVQSKVGDTYKQAKVFLSQNRLVLYSGTPCQLGGLRAFLSKKYENLIQVDLICHGVPSPGVWKSYLEDYEDLGEIVCINMRDKLKGWKNFHFSVVSSTNIRHDQLMQNIYMKGFLQDVFLRKCCYKCSFRSVHRPTDFTIADFWGIEKNCPELDDNKGTSLVLVHTAKGDKLMSCITNMLIVKQQQVGKHLSVENYPLDAWRPEPLKRDHFYFWYYLLGLRKSEFAIHKEAVYVRILRKLKKYLEL